MAVAGAAAAGVLASASLPWAEGVVVLIGLTVFASVVPLRYEQGGEVQELTVDEALLIVALSVVPAAAPLVLGGSTLVAQLLRRRPPLKTAFNAGSVALAAGFGTVAYLSALGPAGVGSSRWVVAAVVGATVHALASVLILGGLFRRIFGRTLWEAIRPTLRMNGVVLVANGSVGLLLALVGDRHPLWLALGVVILAGLYLGYRGFVSAGDEQQRVAEAHEITRLLARATLVDGVFDEVLAVVAGRFGADAVRLEVDSDAFESDVEAYGPELDEEVQLVAGAVRRGAGQQMVRRGSSVAALVVPVSHSGRTLGMLAVAGRRGLEPWTETDLTLLSTIGHEVGVAVANTELLRQVEHERARLEEESSKLADVLAAATDGIGVIRGDGTIDTWNPGMTAVSGVTPGDAIGRPWWTVLRLKDAEERELLPEGDHVVSRALAGERTQEPVGLQALRRDGQWRWVRVSFAPLIHEGGQPDGTVLVVRDVTAEREVASLKADFVATVSHELRTPLTPLKGFVATLKHRGDELDADQRRLLVDSMTGQVGRLERLVSDLLLVADIDNGGLHLQPGAVDLRDSVTAAILAEEPEDQVRIVVTEEAMGQAVGDRQAIVRIARSMISNAVKHTTGRIWVDCGTDGDEAWLTVSDEGPGIPPWEHERVFERFTRLGDHLLRTQGPGLGLPIARALAEELGGTLAIASDVGTGATFRMVLPSARPRQVEVRDHRAG